MEIGVATAPIVHVNRNSESNVSDLVEKKEKEEKESRTGVIGSGD